MANKPLVIVESPTKARTITKFLGKDYIIKASNGHIRDLPNNASEIPLKHKKEPWARLGVNIEADFEPLYVIPSSKKKHVKELKELVKKASIIYLATDEDREGESISWHLLQALKPKVPVKRLVFHEITKDAIKHSLETPREIDENLVKAQETRRIVDRLYGYEVSPLLWKKMASGLSAGRVQSVTVRLLVERERERMAFHKADYWGIKAVFAKSSDGASTKESFEAVLTHVDKTRVAIGKDFDSANGKLSEKVAALALNKDTAQDLKAKLEKAQTVVSSVEEKPYTTRPAQPFVTSTLQQEGNRKLRLSAKRTMTLAQQLYENGFITYMRTDSTTLSTEALTAARTLIKENYGEEYLPLEPRIYKTKVKNAQEAHEAIRPAGVKFADMKAVQSAVSPEAAKLYELIWKRTVACQMTDARGTYVTVGLACENAQFRASGKTIEFPGFLRAYVEGADDPDAELEDKENILPKLSEGENLDTENMTATEHSTQPPARYTEGSLIRELERRGIGRPSTWAAVVETVLNRSYAFKKATALVPTFTGMGVVRLLEQHFTELLDYDFTAHLEDDLDAISRGEALMLDYLRKFYFGNGTKGLKALVKQGEENIDPRVVCGMPLIGENGPSNIEVRIGRYGPFLSDGENRAPVPEGVAPDELSLEEAANILASAARGPESMGLHPETGEPVYLKTGRFGPYVQLGDMVDGGPKPKMVSLLPNMKPEDIDLALGLKLLELPRTLGEHPELKEPVVAAYGRFGPYLKCGSETRSIKLDEFSPLEITLAEAIEVLKRPKAGRQRGKPKVLKELGKHPTTEKEIQVREGPYGPYVTDGKVNASLDKGLDPETVTLEQALNMLEAKEAKGGGKKKAAKKKSSKSKEKSTKTATKTKTSKTTKKKTVKKAASSKAPKKKSKSEEKTSKKKESKSED